MSNVKALSLDQGRVVQTDVWAAPNFSFKKIDSELEIEIPPTQQMILNGPLQVFGQFNVFGNMVFLDLVDDDTPAPPPITLPGYNYSHKRVVSGQTKTIPQNQEMIVTESIKVDGVLQVFGEATIIEAAQEFESPSPESFVDNHSYKKIALNESQLVPANQQMPLVGGLELLGELKVLGQVAMINNQVDEVDDYLPPFIIEASEKFRVGKNRLLSIPLYFRNFGNLELNGLFILGGP